MYTTHQGFATNTRHLHRPVGNLGALDCRVLCAELREHLVDRTLALHIAIPMSYLPHTIRDFTESTHTSLPEEEGQPTEEQDADEHTEARSAGLPEPIVGGEDTVAIPEVFKTLRKHVQEDVVDRDR